MLGTGDDAGEAGDDEGDERGEIDLLGICEGIAAHYETTHSEVVGWPWRLFCVKWARTVRAAAKRERERKAREAERENERLRGALG